MWCRADCRIAHHRLRRLFTSYYIIANNITRKNNNKMHECHIGRTLLWMPTVTAWLQQKVWWTWKTNITKYEKAQVLPDSGVTRAHRAELISDSVTLSQSSKSRHRPVHYMECLFSSRLLLVPIYTAWWQRHQGVRFYNTCLQNANLTPTSCIITPPWVSAWKKTTNLCNQNTNNFTVWMHRHLWHSL